MFVLRCVSGPSIGRYYNGGDFTGIAWVDSPSDAKQLSAQDASGIICASIDMLLTVLAPERISETTEDSVAEFCDVASRSMFQNPEGPMKELFAKTIRSIDDPLGEVPDAPRSADASYMSVYEWLMRAMYRPTQPTPADAAP